MTARPPAQHVRIDHRRTHIRMAEQLLHGEDVITRFQQVGGERMAQRVRRRRLSDRGVAQRLSHGALKRLIAEMMPANDATSRIDRAVFGGKHELPGPFATGVGIFVRKRVR
jgi:hypothetical protein